MSLQRWKLIQNRPLSTQATMTCYLVLTTFSVILAVPVLADYKVANVVLFDTSSHSYENTTSICEMERFENLCRPVSDVFHQELLELHLVDAESKSVKYLKSDIDKMKFIGKPLRTCAKDSTNQKIYSEIYDGLFILIVFIIPIATMIIIYSKIYREMNGKLLQKSPSNQSQLVQKTVIKVISLLVLVYFFCFFPYYLFDRFVYYVARHWTVTPLWLYVVRLLTNTLKYMNPIVNPYLYSFKSGQFKEIHKQNQQRNVARRNSSKSNQFVVTDVIGRLMHGIYAISGELGEQGIETT